MSRLSQANCRCLRPRPCAQYHSGYWRKEIDRPIIRASISCPISRVVRHAFLASPIHHRPMSETEKLDVAEANEKSPPTKDAGRSALRAFARKLHWRAHWLAPNVIPDPHEGGAAFRRDHDAKANEETRVPETEKVRTAALWGIEVFGPSEIDSLYGALEKLDWQRPYTTGDGVLNWIRQQRAYGWGGTYNVGLVTRRGDKRFLPMQSHAPIPEPVEHLWVEVHQISASLTCVLVCFVLKESFAAAYETELNTDRQSVRKRLPQFRGISTLDPTHLKQDALHRARLAYKRIVMDWFGKTMPGFFASLGRIDRFPTAELVTTQTDALFSESTRVGRAAFFGWQRLIANLSASDIWTCQDLAALQFTTADVTRLEVVHFTATLHTSKVPDERFKHYGEKGPGAFIALCRDRLEGIFCYSAVIGYLHEADSELKRTRESMNLSTLRRIGALGVIQGIQDFFDRTMGLPVVARELFENSKTASWHLARCERFTAPGWGKEEVPRKIAEELRAAMHSASSRVLEREVLTREHLEQLSTVMSVRESVKAQRRMEWLTVAALLVATFSFAAAVPEKWLDRAMLMLQAFFE